MTTELKPCPFCGDRMMVESGLLQHVVLAGDSDCPIRSQAWGADRRAIAAWNTRLSHLPQGEVSTTARELLAAEYERDGSTVSEFVRNEPVERLNLPEQRALRAIERALSARPQGEGEVRDRAVTLLAAEMKAEWLEIYRDRETGEEPSEESWLERARNAPASLRAIERALSHPVSSVSREDVLTMVRECVVLAIAFLNRDAGTDRFKRTLPEVIAKLREADAIILSSKSSTPSVTEPRG